MYKKSTSSMPSIGRAHGATVSFSWQFCSIPVEFASLKDDFWYWNCREPYCKLVCGLSCLLTFCTCHLHRQWHHCRCSDSPHSGRRDNYHFKFGCHMCSCLEGTSSHTPGRYQSLPPLMSQKHGSETSPWVCSLSQVSHHLTVPTLADNTHHNSPPLLQSCHWRQELLATKLQPGEMVSSKKFPLGTSHTVLSHTRLHYWWQRDTHHHRIGIIALNNSRPEWPQVINISVIWEDVGKHHDWLQQHYRQNPALILKIVSNLWVALVGDHGVVIAPQVGDMKGCRGSIAIQNHWGLSHYPV